MSDVVEMEQNMVAHPTGTPVGAAPAQRPWQGVEWSRFVLVGVFVVVFILFASLLGKEFTSSTNIANMLSSQAPLVVVVMALMCPLISNELDLSVAANAGLSQMLVGILTEQDHLGVGMMVIVVLGTGAVIGAINGALALSGLDVIIVTLGMSTILTGVEYWISQDNIVANLPNSLEQYVLNVRFLDVPMEFYYALAICAAMWWLVEHTPFGLRLLFVGRSLDVARYVGIKVNPIRFVSLVIAGVLASGAGILYAGNIGSSNPSAGPELLLPAFACSFLGATCFRMGRINPRGAIVAVYMLVMLSTGAQMLGAPSYVEDLVYGIALIVALMLTRLSLKHFARLAMKRPFGWLRRSNTQEPTVGQ